MTVMAPLGLSDDTASAPVFAAPPALLPQAVARTMVAAIKIANTRPLIILIFISVLPRFTFHITFHTAARIRYRRLTTRFRYL
jgi:hypothetical protein